MTRSARREARAIDRPRAALQGALGTRYTIERELGGGGMSRVYLARETALGRTVVIKVIAPELAEGLSAERFTREVKAEGVVHRDIKPENIGRHVLGRTGDAGRG